MWWCWDTSQEDWLSHLSLFSLLPFLSPSHGNAVNHKVTKLFMIEYQAYNVPVLTNVHFSPPMIPVFLPILPASLGPISRAGIFFFFLIPPLPTLCTVVYNTVTDGGVMHVVFSPSK